MTLQRITDRIWYLPHDHFTDRPALYYIRGDRAAMAVDAGASPAHGEAFRKAVQEAGFPLPDYTVLTHWHWDHSFGLCAACGETIATAAARAQLEKVQGWPWNRPAMHRREETGEDIALCNMCIMREYAGRPEDITVTLPVTALTEDRTIDLGGLEARLMCRSSPHSEDSLLVYLPGEKALFAGDADCQDHYHHQGMYEEESLQSWIAFLEGLDHIHHLEGHEAPGSKADVLDDLKQQLAGCRSEADGRALVRAYRGNYIRKMRRHVGHAPLFISGCSVLLENEKGEILLQKRRDNGCWAPPGGAMELGETAENAARREAWEEAGVVAGEMRLLGVYTGEDRYIYYPNGDVCYCTLITFVCRDYVGNPMQDTEEAIEHRFFPRDGLPDILNRCDERSIRDWAAGVTGVVCG